MIVLSTGGRGMSWPDPVLKCAITVPLYPGDGTGYPLVFVEVIGTGNQMEQLKKIEKSLNLIRFEALDSGEPRRQTFEVFAANHPHPEGWW